MVPAEMRARPHDVGACACTHILEREAMWFTLEAGKIEQEREGEVDPFFSSSSSIERWREVDYGKMGNKERGVTQVELERQPTSQIK